MKTLAVVTKAKHTCEALKKQLQTLLDDRIRVEGHYIDDVNLGTIRADLVIASGKIALREASHLVACDCPVILARRSINYHEIGQLLDLPAPTEALLVSDTVPSAEDTITMLDALGIDHIKFHIFAPGVQDYPRLKIAVTPGDVELVPDCVEKIIDIKPRTIDITTLTEILQAFSMLDEKSNLLAASVIRDIVNSMRESKQSSEASERARHQLQTLINTAHDGIIALDASQRISVFNPVAERFFATEARFVIGKTARQLGDSSLKTILDLRPPCDETIVNISARNVVVNAAPLLSDDARPGTVYTFKEVSEIQRIEENVRRKLVGALHVARYTLDDVFGGSESIRRTVDLAQRLARSNAAILLQGESGTGKELLAQGIHNASSRKGHPFIAINFAAMTESLLESELFGYEEGAFTGARKGGATGLFEQAHRGTLFLDEVGDAPLPFQVKLLRVLQEKQVRRVGGARLIPIDVRIISASNQDLAALVKAGSFRKDLYYRLNVLPIEVPALRDRRQDIPELAARFYGDFAGDKSRELPPGRYFSAIADALLAYDWPGNIRELQNVVEYLANISPEHPPTPDMLPRELRHDGRLHDRPNDTQIDRLILETISTYRQRNRTVGRRTLAATLKLPERAVRNALERLQQEGLIRVSRGRGGVDLP